jgi:sporulation integral membrane protein YtvI
MTTERKRKILIDALYLALIGAVLWFCLRYLAAWLLPFVIGMLIAFVLQKPVAYLARRTKLPRGLWSGLLVFVLLGAVLVLLGFLAERIAAESAGFPEWLRGLTPQLEKAFGDMEHWFAGVLDGLPNGLEAVVRESPMKLLNAAIGSLSGFLTSFSSGLLTRVPNILLTTILSVVAACFLTSDYPRISRFFLAQFSPEKQAIIRSAKRLFTENILKMLRGYFILFLLTFAELFAGFLILRIEYAAVLALLIAVLDILPVVGTGTVLLPWAAVQLLLGQGTKALQLVGLYLVITVVRNVLEPRVIGRQVGLPPIVTLVAMYLGLKLFGFFGLFALPILVILLAKLQEGGMLRIWKTPGGDDPLPDPPAQPAA